MNRSLHVFLSCNPPKTTAQGKRLVIVGGKPVFFKKKAQADSENLFEALLVQHQPEKPFGPCAVKIQLCFPFRKAEPKKNRHNGLLHTVKPDLDNWVKGFIDRIVALNFLRDDAEICELAVSKEYSDSPGIHLQIIELEALPCR